MRIHTMAALYVFAFSFFFELSRTNYAVLCLTFALVMMAEMFNTVAEELSDQVAASYNPVVRIVKDLAAGAVLICAALSIGVGICLFWRPAVLLHILWFFLENPVRLLLFLTVTALGIVYVMAGPLGIRDFLRKKRN